MGNREAGMCKNPFGGRERLDKCDLRGPSVLNGVLVDVLSNVPGERNLIAELFRDAAFNYLYYGMGQNGTGDVEEFFFSCEWLLRTRSYKPETWASARLMRTTYRDEVTGKRITRTKALTDRQLELMCADRAFQLLEQDRFRDLEEFVAALRKLRRQIIQDNHAQIVKFLDILRNKTVPRNVPRSKGIPLLLLTQDMETILTEASDPEDLSALTSFWRPTRRLKCAQTGVQKTRPKATHVRRKRPKKGDLLASLEVHAHGSVRDVAHRSAELAT